MRLLVSLMQSCLCLLSPVVAFAVFMLHRTDSGSCSLPLPLRSSGLRSPSTASTRLPSCKIAVVFLLFAAGVNSSCSSYNVVLIHSFHCSSDSFPRACVGHCLVLQLHFLRTSGYKCYVKITFIISWFPLDVEQFFDAEVNHRDDYWRTVKLFATSVLSG